MRDHPVLCRDNAAPADGLMERVLRLERIVEQIGGVLLPQNMKDIVEGVQHVPEKRVLNSVVEQIGSASAPDLQLIPQNRTQEPIVGVPDKEEEIAAVPVPRIMNDIVDVERFSPLERVLSRTSELIVDVTVPRILEAAVEVAHAPQECVQNRTLEQIVDVLVPQIREDGL